MGRHSLTPADVDARNHADRPTPDPADGAPESPQIGCTGWISRVGTP